MAWELLIPSGVEPLVMGSIGSRIMPSEGGATDGRLSQGGSFHLNIPDPLMYGCQGLG